MNTNDNLVYRPRPVLPKSELGKAITLFLNAKSGTAVQTQKTYLTILSQFADYTLEKFGDEWPISPDHINAFLAAKHKEGAAGHTVHGCFRAIKTLCRWLIKRKKISREDDPIELAERPRLPKLIPRHPEAEDVATLISFLKDHSGPEWNWRCTRNLALIALLADCGLRIAEACALEIGDINLERCEVILRNTKTGTDGVSVFSPVVAEYLTKWLKIRATLDFPPKLDKALFVCYQHHNGWNKLKKDGGRTIVTMSCKAAGIKRINPHGFRHFCAIQSLRNGADLVEVQKQLRHANSSMTARYLIQADKGRAARQAAFSPLSKLGPQPPAAPAA